MNDNTPAASGAAPADWRPALHEARELAIKHGAVENDGMQMSVELYMTPTTLAKVIAEARARTALASPQVAAEPVPVVKFVPVSAKLRDGNGNHPNDNEPRTDACCEALSLRGDDEGQGLDSFWKWGFAAGFNACLATPAQVAPPSSGGRKATPAMLQAGAAVIDRETRGLFKQVSDGTTTDTARMVWREMNAAAPAAPQPIGYAVERSAFRVSPHGQDAESREWMEFTDDPKEKGAFPVWAAPVAPQDDARDAALWREHVAKLDALVTYCPTCCQGFYASKEMTRDEIIFECGKTVGRSTPAAKPTEPTLPTQGDAK